MNNKIKRTLALIVLLGVPVTYVKGGEKEKKFKKSMELIYPNFEKEGGGQVVSKTQLEYVIRLCNEHQRNLTIKNLATESKNADIVLDLSKMSEIIQVDQGSKDAVVESGITIK